MLMSQSNRDAERELELLRAAVRAVVSVNDSPEGAVGDTESLAGPEAADALRRALSREAESPK